MKDEAEELKGLSFLLGLEECVVAIGPDISRGVGDLSIEFKSLVEVFLDLNEEKKPEAVLDFLCSGRLEMLCDLNIVGWKCSSRVVRWNFENIPCSGNRCALASERKLDSRSLLRGKTYYL